MKKLTTKERIKYLIDPHTEILTIGEDIDNNKPSGITIALGYIHNLICVIVANNHQIKSGCYFPITIKKHLRAQEIAIQNHIPIIYLVDSAGIYLPLQEEIFPDNNDFGKIFYQSAKMSAKGIIQIAAIMGHCVAGGAYLPILSDESFMVDKSSGLFLAGSYLVKSAIGEKIDNETLGGSTMHCGNSGIVDYKFDDEKKCLEAIRKKIAKFTHHFSPNIIPSNKKVPKLNIQYALKKLSKTKKINQDTNLIIEGIVDQNSFEPYKALYGQTLLCGYAYIEGFPVGIIANQRKMVKKTQGETQIGGVIYPDSAQKATKFIMNCNQHMIPLVFLQDVNGFIIGSKAEKQGMLKEGAKMIHVIANTVVPKFTVIIGNAYGAGYYAMCGRAFKPNLILAWPQAKIGVMQGKIAASTLINIKKNTLNEEEEKIMRQNIEKNYSQKTDIKYAASKLWIDAIISPEKTRYWLAKGLEAASYAPKKKMKIGMLQI